MTRKEEAAKLRKLEAAIGAAHALLHAGQIDEAHNALHCGVGGEDVASPHLDPSSTANLHRFGSRFNKLAADAGLVVAWIALVPDPAKPGFMSVQIGGAVTAIRYVRQQMRLASTIAAGDHAVATPSEEASP